MESAREKRRNSLFRAIAIAMTLLIHVALFAGIYYAMDGGTGDTELVENKKDQLKKKAVART